MQIFEPNPPVGHITQLWAARSITGTKLLTNGKSRGSLEPEMDQPQADFFKANVLPIIREAGENRERPSERQYNPLRPMLRMLLVYIDYLEGAGAQTKKETKTDMEARA